MLWRYRFETKEYKDDKFHKMFEALQMPYWISGENKEKGCAIITCYLPPEAELRYLVDDATNIEAVQCDYIEYSKHFPLLDWISDPYWYDK